MLIVIPLVLVSRRSGSYSKPVFGSIGAAGHERQRAEKWETYGSPDE